MVAKDTISLAERAGVASQNKTTRAKGVRASKDTISGSEDDSRQTLPDASIFNDDSVETPSTLYDAPSFEDGVLGAGSLEDEVDVVAKNTKLTSCYDIPLLRGWLVAGLPLICTKWAEHQGISLWAGPTSMIAHRNTIHSNLMFMCSTCKS
jgi:hypothetical protein